jgi:hypothetical protein
MSNDEREYLDKKLEYESKRGLSPETKYKIEEDRRIRDNELQERIYNYTRKLMQRQSDGTNISNNPKKDRLQAVRDLKELKSIKQELEQRRAEIQHNHRTYTGDLIYKDKIKLNRNRFNNYKNK